MGKKVLILVLVIISCFCILASCSEIRYNAVILTDGYTFNADFLRNNVTDGSLLLENGESVDGEDGNYPKDKIICLKSQAEHNAVFSDFAANIDYEKETLIIYICTSIIPNKFELKKVILDGDTLKINYTYEKSLGAGDNATSPKQRCMVIKTDKLDFKTVVINEL